MSKVKVLCTGSGGFIFSNFIRYVLKNRSDYHIASIDAIKDSKVLNTIYSNKSHVFYMGDIIDTSFIDNVMNFERPDVIIHGAAESFVDKSITAGPEFVKSNVLGTQILLDAAIKWKVSKFIYISTDEVYGHLINENESAWTEEAPLNPRNVYSSTKAAGEMLVKAAHNVHGLQYNITRSCNNYGPKQPRRNLVPVIISNIIENQKIPIYDQGMQLREWLHVQDNCNAILTILEKGKTNETYNISANHEFRNIEVFHKICEILGRGHDLLEFVKDRPGHDFRYAIDATKLKELGWQPEFKFKAGLEHTVHWMTNNYSWFLKR